MRTILIVDDTKELRKLVRMTLEYEDLRVIEASTGTQALDLASKHNPDIIIMDFAMPGVSMAWRQQDRSEKIPGLLNACDCTYRIPEMPERGCA